MDIFLRTKINKTQGENRKFPIFMSKKGITKPSSANPLYQRKIKIGCPYCERKGGRKKDFKTLWCLYYHFLYHHSEKPYKELIEELADLVIKGVIF